MNCSDNCSTVFSTSSGSIEPTALAEPYCWNEIIFAVVFCIVIIVTVVGNTLVIIAVLTTRRLRTVTNCYVLSLAVADWLVGVFVMPPAVVFYLKGSWELGWVMCDIWISLDVLCCTASILSLCTISVDRYLAVTQPLNYSRRRRSKKLALYMIIVVWLLAIAITCPPIFGWYDSEHHADKTCRYNQNEGYVIFSAVGSFFLPLAVMLYMYTRISCVVAQRHQELGNVNWPVQKHGKVVHCVEETEFERISSEAEEMHAMVVQCTSLSSYTTTVPHRQSSVRAQFYHKRHSSQSQLIKSGVRCSFYNARVSRQPSMKLDGTLMGQVYGTGCPRHEVSSRVSSFKRENKTTQTLMIVVGGFVACWLPFFVVYLITPYLPQQSIPKLLQDSLTWLGWINSGINPFIYAFYNLDFRTAFWRLTLHHCVPLRKKHLDPSRHRSRVQNESSFI